MASAAGLVRPLLARPVNAILILALAFAALWAVSSLWLPFGWDDGMMASVGDVIAHGGMPYRDAWDVKAPMAFVPFALTVALFDHQMWGIRLFELALMIPTLLFFRRVVGALTLEAIGSATALALYLWIAAAGFSFTGQPEIWAMAAVTIAMCLLLRPNAAAKSTPLVFLIIGLLIGSAGMVKPHFMGFGLTPLVFLAIAPGLSLMRRAVLAVPLAIGAVVPMAALVAWIVAGGALPAFIEVFKFVTGPYGGPASGHNMSTQNLLLGMAKFLASGGTPVLILLACVGVWARRREGMLLALLLTWLFMAILGVALQAKLYAYHWFLMYPPLIFCAALGVHALVRGGTPAKILAAAAGLAFAALIALSPVKDVARWARLMIDGDKDKYYGGYYMAAYNSRDIVNAAHYVRDHTAPDETLFVWGNDATIRFLSERRNPTRFVYELPLSLNSEFRPGYRAELLQKLRDTPPAYIAVGSPWGETGPFGPKANSWADFPEFASVLAEDYDLEVAFGNVDLYARKGRSSAQ